MVYLAKSTVLHAYKLLSDIDSEKQQGLTQKVSALKYASALDLFYKHHGQNCDLKQSANRDEFASNVGEIVKINEEYCTKDFFLSISQNGRDFDCGSNFYSQSSVKDSKTNPNNTFLYPKRSGWKPVMDIQNQVLIYRVDYLNDCFSFYLGSSELRLAFIIWLLRFKQIPAENLNGIKSTLNTVFTSDYSEALYTDDVNHVDTSYVEFDEDVCQLINEDVHSLFANSSDPSIAKTKTMKNSLQQIFYGAPGTGKSHEIKEKTEGKLVIRTTFHPDSDYSTFVGAYKPTTIEVPMRDVTGKVIVENGERVTENRIVYEFVEQAFLQAYTKAWKQYASSTVEGKEPEEVYLVIEEINRGNCAQIFGDLFQLLDRGNNGFSEYPIMADKDLQKQLAKAFDNMAFLNAPAICGMSGEDVAVKIRRGEILLLPNNLYIWATMNTSDQSLFPIDSAFKRRWDWQYIPISDGKKGWQIEVNGKRYDWWQFLQKINDKIGSTTNSEDKKLGYFFCKAKNGIIDVETFVGKVVFYIWNDVFKDFAEDAGDLFKDEDSSLLSFNKFYIVDDRGKIQVVVEKIEKLLDNLGLFPIVDNYETFEEDNDDAIGQSEENQRDKTRYSINGQGSFFKKQLPFEAVSLYIQHHPNSTAQELADTWYSLETMIRKIVITSSEYEQKLSQTKDNIFASRYDPIDLNNGEKVYVYNQFTPERINDFITKVNNQNWDIHIQTLEE